MPRFRHYLDAVAALDAFARANYGKRVIHLALRWVLDRADTNIALWGARHPGQLAPIDEVMGWRIDAAAMAAIDGILARAIPDTIGPEFIAPPDRLAA
jgi:aryl-alcohol dehydrogenase-like predicted oxidoreductase